MVRADRAVGVSRPSPLQALNDATPVMAKRAAIAKLAAGSPTDTTTSGASQTAERGTTLIRLPTAAARSRSTITWHEAAPCAGVNVIVAWYEGAATRSVVADDKGVHVGQGCRVARGKARLLPLTQAGRDLPHREHGRDHGEAAGEIAGDARCHLRP